MNRLLSFPTRILFWFLALSFLVSCGGDEPIDPTPVTPVNPNPPTPEKDTTAPTITVAKSTLNVISGPSLTVSGNEMKIGSDLVASWKDDKSTSCTVSIIFTGKDGTTKAVNPGDKLEEEGKLKLKVTDEAGNSSEAEIALTKTDSQAPGIEVKIAEKNVIAGVKVKVEGNLLFFDGQVAATWKDDYTENCKVEITLVPEEGESKAVNSGDVIKEVGKLLILVQDDYENKATAEITLTKNDTQAPTITVLIQEKNVITGVKVKVEGNQLFFDDQVAATWADDFTEICSTLLSLDGQAINTGDILLEAGKLVIAVSDDFKNETKAEITLLAEAVYGLENLQGKTLQVDQEVNLLDGITFAEGLTLQKVEIEQEGVRSEIPNPRAYIPELPGTVSIILTLTKADGSTIEVWVDNLTIKGLEYQSISINSIKPEEILPVIWQVNWWDKHVYDHIEHLRIAEAARVIDMMGKYGAGDYSSEEYRVLLKRLNTWMTEEEPRGYDNFEIIWGDRSWLEPSSHAYAEFGIMNDVIVIGKYSNFMIVSEINDSWYGTLSTFVKEHLNTINIFWNSTGYKADTREEYEEWVYRDAIINLCKEKNFVLFASWSNVLGQRIKAFNGAYELDEFGQYCKASMANSDKNNQLDIHLFATFSTDEDWDADLCNRTADSSKFPVGFNRLCVFSGRAFPVHDFQSWLIVGRKWNFPTSDPNYLNVTLADLCFQVRADVKDVDELMDMIRSTALTNYIRLDMNGDGDTDDVYNGHPETQPLQLINPAWVLKKYCLLSDIPNSISTGESIMLTKGWYKGLIFNIPGAEVLVNGEWIPFTSENASRIKATNPMNLEWRLNGTLLRKYGYTPGQTLQGQIITVDDQWNGLRLEKDITIQIN